MTDSIDRPRLRPDLELLGGDIGGESVVVLRDPEALAVEVLPFGEGAVTLFEYLDGTHTLEDIRTDLAARGAGFLPEEQLRAFVDTLDDLLLLDNEASRAELRAREDYLAAPVRPAAHAGRAYPDDAAGARAFLQGMLDESPAAADAELSRLIAPHIDLDLGRDVHGAAHRRLAAGGRPDVVVVLGVRHAAGEERFVACRKDFETPLGTVRHDATLLDALEARCGPLDGGRIAHRTEHSVEFQALWLAHHWPGDPPAIVPLLVGSFHDLVEAGASPSEDANVERFVGALRDAVAADGRDVLVVASVDLSHVGPIYDDPEGLDEEGEHGLEQRDRTLLEPVLRGDAEAWFEGVARDGNASHVCGLAPVYVALRLGDAGGEGELLRYGQGRIHPETGSVVSYAAVAFGR